MKQLFAMVMGFALGFGAPTFAEGLGLGTLSSYLNGLQNLTGDFTQLNDDGTISTGKIYLKRPGRVRFEYDPPEQLLVVADGISVGIVDGKANNHTEAYPLGRTPLKIILARNVDLTREKMVTSHTFDGTSTTVRAEDPKNPDYGNIELVFTGSNSAPVELRQWVINDGNGGRTTVILGALDLRSRIDDAQFVIPGRERGGTSEQ